MIIEKSVKSFFLLENYKVFIFLKSIILKSIQKIWIEFLGLWIIALFHLASAAKLKCLNDCGLDYKPVCGGPDPRSSSVAKPISFGSKCVLDNYNCEKGLGNGFNQF